MKFYVYEWFNENTGEIFYVGKGCKNRCNQITKRNKLFQEYYANNKCSNRIIKYFDNEEEAFNFEHSRIIELKSINQAHCNLDNGGKGGYNFVWNDEMRKYKSLYNPMKNQYQKDRMSKDNPMKNPNVILKVKEKTNKKVVLGNKIYGSIKELANEYGIYDTAIQYWLQRGYGRNQEPCYYYGETPKEIIIRNHETSNKPILVDGNYFKNVKSAAQYIGVWSESVIRAIKDNRMCKGHKCEYVNQQPSTSLND